MKVKEKHVRTPKGKSPKQLAKKQANVAAYEARCRKLRELQAAKNEQRQNAVLEYQRRIEQEIFQKNYVEAALNGPAKIILNRWLAGRPAFFLRVYRFFQERKYLPQPLEPQPNTNKAA